MQWLYHIVTASEDKCLIVVSWIIKKQHSHNVTQCPKVSMECSVLHAWHCYIILLSPPPPISLKERILVKIMIAIVVFMEL